MSDMEDWFKNFSIDFGDNNAKPQPSMDNSVPDSNSLDTSRDNSPVTEVTAVEIIPAEQAEILTEIFGETPQEVGPALLDIASVIIQSKRQAIVNNEEYAKATARQAEIDAEIREQEKVLTELKRKKQEANSIAWDFRNALNATIKTTEEKKAEARQIRANFLAEKEIEYLSDAMLEKAKQFPWFTGMENGLKCLDHQWDAIRFMVSGKRVILGDEMGLGKTLSSIGSLDVADAKRILIISPADITGNFYEEIAFWAGHRAAITIRGESKIVRKQMLDAIQMLDSFIVIVNYEAWRKDFALLDQLTAMGFDTLICDEAHTIKGTNTNAYRGVKQIAHAVNKCPNDGTIRIPGKPCPNCGWEGQSYAYEGGWAEGFWKCRSIERIFMMSGSVILNKPDDLFSPLSILDPVTFANLSTFLRTYAEFDYDRQVYGFAYGGLERLKRRLSGKFLARKMTDAGIILPPQKPIVHEVTLDGYPMQASVIEQISKYMEIALDNDRRVNITAIIAMITRQRQASVFPGGITIKEPNFLENGEPNPRAGEIIWRVADEINESVKLDKAVDLIREFTATGQRVVVFSQFSTALRELESRLDGALNDNSEKIAAVVFDGQTPQDTRTEIRRNFDRKMGEEKKWDVVLANYKTGGVGVNLTAATHTIILDREWNPGKENQALARTNRMGQTEANFIHIIEIADTIDQWMNNIINQKAKMIDGFNEGADSLREELLQKLKKRNK